MLRPDGVACLFGALMLLVLPLDWLLSAVTAAVFHELCHVIAICLVGGRVLSVTPGIHSAVIRADIPEGKGEFLCALAGPAGSLLLASCRLWLPKVAVCAFIQGVFNLLPVYPMDGGRMLRILLEKLTPAHANGVFRWIETVTVMLAVGSLLLLSLSCPGCDTALLAVAWVFRWICRKIPCKRGKNRVQ